MSEREISSALRITTCQKIGSDEATDSTTLVCLMAAVFGCATSLHLGYKFARAGLLAAHSQRIALHFGVLRHL